MRGGCLRELNLDGCSGLGDAAVRMVCRACPGLAELSLLGCPAVRHGMAWHCISPSLSYFFRAVAWVVVLCGLTLLCFCSTEYVWYTFWLTVLSVAGLGVVSLPLGAFFFFPLFFRGNGVAPPPARAGCVPLYMYVRDFPFSPVLLLVCRRTFVYVLPKTKTKQKQNKTNANTHTHTHTPFFLVRIDMRAFSQIRFYV